MIFIYKYWLDKENEIQLCDCMYTVKEDKSQYDITYGINFFF